MPAVKDPAWRPWLKESNIKVSAVVFYGRRRYVRILDKYLKQNLCSAGGLLQEVTHHSPDHLQLPLELVLLFQ